MNANPLASISSGKRKRGNKVVKRISGAARGGRGKWPFLEFGRNPIPPITRAAEAAEATHKFSIGASFPGEAWLYGDREPSCGLTCPFR